MVGGEGTMGCIDLLEKMKWRKGRGCHELPLATKKMTDRGEGEGLPRATVSCQKMTEIWGEERLS